MRFVRRTSASARRLAWVFAAFLAAVLSCGREPTAPGGGSVRYARGLAFRPIFPSAVQQALQQAGGAAQIVPFNQVRVVLHHSDGSIALDTLVDFPPGVDELTQSFTVALLAGAPTTGEPMLLDLAYLDHGLTVYSQSGVPVLAAPAVPGQPAPPPVDVHLNYVGPGANATSVAITPRTATAFTGDAFTFTAVARDGSGNPVPGTPIVWTSLDPGIAVMQSVNAGVATAQAVRGTAHIQAQLLTGPADQVTLAVQLRASAIAAQSGTGQSAAVGQPLAQPLVVKVTASDGVPVSGVAVAFAAATGGGGVGAASVTTDVLGLAQTTWTLGSTVGTQTATASVAGLTGSPVTFSATGLAATATKLAVTTQPVGTLAGATLAIVEVTARDALNNTAAAFTGSVTLAFGANPGAATLGGTVTVSAVAGVATFTTLTVNRPGAGYTLVATSSGLASATSAPFNITVGPTTKLVFTQSPASTTAGAPLGSVQVSAQDLAGNATPTFVGTVLVALGANPGAGVLSGVGSATAVAGVATFPGLSINRPGSGYTLVASATGFASGTSAAFDIALGPPAQLVLASGGGQSGSANAALPQPIVVQVADAGGNALPTSGRTVTFAVVTGGGTVAPTTTTTTGAGQASTTWTLGSLAGTQTMSATSAPLGPVTIAATASSVGNHLTVTQQPGATHVAGTIVAPGFIVEARDAANALVPTFTGTVTLAIGTNPGGASLGGTVSVAAVGGVATFNAFSLNRSGTGYTVVAGAGAFGSVTSNAFNITPAAAAAIVVQSGDLQTAPVSTTLPLPLLTRVQDAFGNGVSGITVNYAVATGGGSVSQPAAPSGPTGSAATNWTLGPAAGPQTVTATAAGLAGSPLTFTANPGGGVVATTTVTPTLDTLTALTATFPLTAQARNAAGGAVTGSFTWVSRNPAFVTVNASGLVTAVANGQTYVVATETGGTRDSALIVVQQRFASINVTPNARSIYLTRTFAFAATAVDGNGFPVSGITSFTWSTTAPAVATVDAAGLVTAVGLGSVQIRATNGAITGVSNVNVITPITSIIVSRDSAGFSTAVNDAFTLTSLGRTRSYRATAYDTVGAVMPGVTFSWASSNGSVAVIDSSGPVTARANSAANGTTAIQATAQGVTGAAALTVSQVLAAIDLTPVTATIGIGGTQPMLARGLDANSRFISTAVAFTYSTSNAAIATVSAAGVVTGVALGTANITAQNGAITSNVAAITVAAAGVPAVITFGRDTLSVGRSGSVSIPIFLSRPNGTALTVNLAVRDTFAFWSAASVSIPAGQTSVNATLNGHNAGTTQVYALDGSGQGFAGDTAVLAVQATLRLTSTSYGVNATDVVATQVLMSDPSPAGGTYVTFNFSVPGIASVSPNPAFIPAGQLAADIQILGVAAGTTNITPTAIGVNGTAASFQTLAASLTFSTTFVRLGTGQYEPNVYVTTPTYTVNALPVTFTSSDTTRVTVTPSAIIPGGSYYAYITLTARSPGTVTITPSSPGWTAGNTLTVTVTTPMVAISGGGTLNTTSPQTNVTVYTADSVRSSHARTSSLVLRVSSTDTTVMRVIDTLVTIGPSQVSTTARVIPGGAGGTARVRVTASGHTSDSTLYTVIGPKLDFSWTTSRIGLDQEDVNVYVTTPNNVTAPLVVSLSADTSRTGIPPSVTIPTGLYYAYFTVRAKATGTVPIIASAPGYQGDTATYIVTTPRLLHSGGGTVNNFAPPSAFYIYVRDSASGGGHTRMTPLVVTLRSTDTTVIKVDTLATIPVGQEYTTTPPTVTYVGTGTAKVMATAPGHFPDSLSYTVVTPKLSFNTTQSRIGRGQHFLATDFYVTTPNNVVAPVAVTLTQKQPAVITLSSTSLTIPAASYYSYFTPTGIAFGADTIIATAAGYNPDTVIIRVTTPKLAASGLPGSTTTTNPPINLNVYAEDSLNSIHYVNTDLVVRAVSSDSNVIRPAQPYFHILQNGYYATTSVNVIGPGSASITYSDSAGTGYLSTTTNTMSVTGPSLTIANGTPMLGMRQNSGPTGWYVYTPNNVGTPLTVNLVATGGGRVATVPASVIIPAGTYYAYFQVTAQDTLGTIQVQASATGYTAASSNVQVTVPKFLISTPTSLRTTQAAQILTVYAADANGTTHYVNENVAVTLASSASSVASIDSAVVTILAGASYTQGARWSPGVVGTSQLSMSDARSVFYKYTPATVNVAVTTPALSFSFGGSSLGIGQYTDNVYVQTPDYQTSPLSVAFTHVGTARLGTSTNGTNTAITGLTIAAGIYYTYFRITGVSTGTDSLVASATSPAHRPDTAATTVGPGRIDPLSGWPATNLRVGDSVAVTLYVRDPAQGVRNVVAATTFTLAPNANVEFRSGGAGSTVITSVTVPAAAQGITFYLKGVSAGAGSATITATNYQSYTNGVTVIP